MVNITTNVDIHVDTYGHPYTSTDGVTYSNMTYYPIAHENGKVAIRATGGNKPSLRYAVHPVNFANYTNFVYEPAYVDTDANG